MEMKPIELLASDGGRADAIVNTEVVIGFLLATVNQSLDRYTINIHLKYCFRMQRIVNSNNEIIHQ